MRRQIQKAFVLTVVIVVTMLIAGCKKEGLSNTKKSRLIAAENIQLKKQLRQCKEQIDEQKKAVKQQSPEQMENIMNELSKVISKESTTALQENEKLKAQVKELQREKDNLKAQIQQLEKEIEELKKTVNP